MYNNIFSSSISNKTSGYIGSQVDAYIGHNLYQTDEVYLDGPNIFDNSNNLEIENIGFKDKPNRNYSLKANSPAIDAGAFSYSSDVYDELGNSNAPQVDRRNYFRVGIPDIGAYEFQGFNSWLGTVSSEWSDGSNWSLGIVPTQSHLAYISDAPSLSRTTTSLTKNIPGTILVPDVEILLCLTSLTVVFSLSINSFTFLPSAAFIKIEGILIAVTSPPEGVITFKSSVQLDSPVSLPYTITAIAPAD